MRIETESGGTTNDPNTSDLAAALRGLDLDGNTYAILAREKNDFVQVLRVGESEYRVERHDPASDGHFTAKGTLPLNDVIALFEDFRRGGTQWKSMADFQPTELKSKSGCAGRGAATLIVLSAIIVLVARSLV